MFLPAAGRSPAFWQTTDVRRARAEAGDPGRLFRQVPGAPRGRGSRGCRRRARSTRPSARPPTTKFHIIQALSLEPPVVGLEIDVEVHLLQGLEQDAPVAVHDRLRQPRRARAVQHPQRMIPAPCSNASLRRRRARPASAPAPAVPRAAARIEVAENHRALTVASAATSSWTPRWSKSLPPYR